MRRTVIATAVVAALALPAAARAETSRITMPGKYFDPSHSTIVAGDTIVFRNNDLVTHDVRIGGGVFDSGPIGRFTSWSQQIDQPGGYPFVCTLHAFMGGYLDVVASTLAAAPDGVLAGEPLMLSGRAPAGTAHVGVERSISGGAWSADGDGAAPAQDGTFEATVKAAEGASYRVTTPAGASPAVTPRVTARVDVHIDVLRSRHHIDVRVHTMPAATGFLATLERYSRWHFRWRPARRVKLDSRGRASFRLSAASRSFARVALSRSRRGPALVRSGVVKLRSAMAAVDPDTITPHEPGAHGGGAHGGSHG
jgi:plastocyanin